MQSQMKSDSISDKPLPHNPDPEQRLLDFVEGLILDLAHTHPRVRDLDVALWVARVAVGVKK